MKMKIVVNFRGTVKRVEIAVKIIITVKIYRQMRTNLMANTRRMKWIRMGTMETANTNIYKKKEVKVNHSYIWLLHNMALI